MCRRRGRRLRADWGHLETITKWLQASKNGAGLQILSPPLLTHEVIDKLLSYSEPQFIHL
jgi:hypothetical protein